MIPTGCYDIPLSRASIGLILLVSLLGVVFRKRSTSPAVQQPVPKKPGDGLRFLLQGLLPIVVTILITFALSTLVSLSGLTTGKPNGLGILLLVIFALFIFLLWMVLYIGGVRQALENKGLLAPIATLKLLLKDRALTGWFLLNLILLGGITVVTTAIGLVLFILPGLAAFVLSSLALWYVFAQYSINAKMFVPAFDRAKNIPFPDTDTANRHANYQSLRGHHEHTSA